MRTGVAAGRASGARSGTMRRRRKALATTVDRRRRLKAAKPLGQRSFCVRQISTSEAEALNFASTYELAGVLKRPARDEGSLKHAGCCWRTIGGMPMAGRGSTVKVFSGGRTGSVYSSVGTFL